MTAGAYFLAGIAVGLRFQVRALVVVIPLGLVGAIALRQLDGAAFDPVRVVLLIALLQAGFLCGALIRSWIADRRR